MPTAAKLVSGVAFALLGYVVAMRVIANVPYEFNAGWFREMMALFGLFVGWKTLGTRATWGLGAAVGGGLTAAAGLAFLGLVLVAVHDMIVQSMRGSYSGPFAAIEDMFAIAGERSLMLLNPDVGGLLVVGGMVAGGLAWMAGRLWN